MMLLLLWPLLLVVPTVVFSINLGLLRSRSRLSFIWCLVIAFLTGIGAVGADFVLWEQLLYWLNREGDLLTPVVLIMSAAMVVVATLAVSVVRLSNRNGPLR
jgi:hypothetical protein